MDYLRAFAEEFGLKDVINAATERDDVQGAILTLDEWWLAAWKLRESGRLHELEWRGRAWHHFLPGPIPPFFEGIDQHLNTPPWIPFGRPDLTWRPPFWSEYTDFASGRGDDMPPVRLIVCLRPPKDGEKVRGFDSLSETRLPISYEVRPPARFANAHRAAVRPVVGGVSVGEGAKAFGTLGGIVKDRRGARFGATCGHVFPASLEVDQPAKRDDMTALRIGTSDPVSVPQQCASSAPCNPYTSSAHISDVDTALIALDDGVDADLEVLAIGPLSGVVPKNSMTPGQSIEFAGRTSGHRVAEVGGLAIFYRMRMNGKTYCFRDLFEVRWKNWFRTLRGPIVQAGDSGAWVCAATAQGMGWCGQILGEDRNVGYAAFAENTVAAWGNTGKQLDVK